MSLGSFFRRGTSWSTAIYLQPALTLPPLGEPDHLLRGNAPLRLPWSSHTRADPFLFVRDDRLYLFYESQVADDFGRIDCAEIDGHRIRHLGTVLAEPFHLSYPSAFADGQAPDYVHQKVLTRAWMLATRRKRR